MEEYALILDCHSFNNLAYKCDKIHKACRPDICIGTDAKHTPTELTDIVVKYFTALGYEVALNNPFSGTMIPQWFDYNDNLYSIMIEINRKLYIDWKDDDVKKSDSFDKLKGQIYDLEKLLELYMKQKCLKKETS